MEPGALPSKSAWQPLTPKGVAAFARAPSARLFLVELLVALIVAGITGWFAQSAWCPVVAAAIAKLPDQGEIRDGRMDWRGAAPQVLAENHFLALSVDLQHAAEAHSPAHLQVEFGQADVQIDSLFGYVRFAYWRGWVLPCSRAELTPWWGAWRPPLLALLVFGVILFLILSWSLLAMVYSLPAWLLAFFLNRDLALRCSWRLCSASLMPGALLMSGAIVLFRLGLFDLVGLSVAVVVHFIVGWGFIVAGVLHLDRLPSLSAPEGNPFVRAAINQTNVHKPSSASEPQPDREKQT